MLPLDLESARSYSQMLKQAGLAQLVERAIRNRKVIGSTPIAGSRFISVHKQSKTANRRPQACLFCFVTLTMIRRWSLLRDN